MSLTQKEYKERLSLGDNNNALIRLIAVLLVFFVLLIMMRSYFYFLYKDDAKAIADFTDKVLTWFVLPADANSFFSKPWTLLTSFFSHINVWSIFANTLWLWVFGYIFQDLTGNRKIIPVFLYGGIAAGLSYLAVAAFSGGASFSFFGANAAVMSVAAATTATCPTHKIFPQLKGGFPLWMLTAFYVMISFGTAPVYGLEYFIPLLTAMLVGWLFIFLIKKGYDLGGWMADFYDWVNNLFNPEKQKKEYNIKQHLFYKSSGKPYSKTIHVTQKRIDEILDKIQVSGFNSLTEEEKDVLARAKDEDL